jgi:hypothetical protein
MDVKLRPSRYTATIVDTYCVADKVSYVELLRAIVEFTLRAAAARSIEESDWAHEELRRSGLASLQIFRDDKAIWTDTVAFSEELAARPGGAVDMFAEHNEIDPDFYALLERDLQALWRSSGYDAPTLLNDMKRLFTELEREMETTARYAREGFVRDILSGLFPDLS